MKKKLMESAPVEFRKHSRFKDVWRRFCKNKMALFSLVFLIILFIICLFPSVFAPYGYAETDSAVRFAYPYREHLLGTDNMGRDLLSRIIYGGKISLLVSVMSIAMAVVIGCFVGSISAYCGGVTDSIIMRIFDIIMAIPSLLLAVCIQSILGSGIQNAAVAIAISNVPLFARVSRSAVLSVKEQEYVEASRAIGGGSMYIIFRQILPNTLATIIVNATMMLGAAILTISSLSFVGLGVQLPIPEWGSILASGRQYIRDFYPLVLFPGIAILLTVFAFNIVGDGLRDALDPRLKQ